MLDTYVGNHPIFVSDFDQTNKTTILLENEKKIVNFKQGKTKALTISLPDPVPLQRGLYVNPSGNTTPSTVNTFGLEEGIDSFKIDADDRGDEISCFGNDELEDLEHDFDYDIFKPNMRSNKASFDTVVRDYSTLNNGDLKENVELRSYLNRDNKNINNKSLERKNFDDTNINNQSCRNNSLEAPYSVLFDQTKIPHNGKHCLKSRCTSTISNNLNFQRMPPSRAKRKKNEERLNKTSFNGYVRNKHFNSLNRCSLQYHLEEINKVHQYHISLIHDLEQILEKKEACIENLKNQVLIGQQKREREKRSYQDKLSDMMLASKIKVYNLEKELDEYKKVKAKQDT